MDQYFATMRALRNERMTGIILKEHPAACHRRNTGRITADIEILLRLRRKLPCQVSLSANRTEHLAFFFLLRKFMLLGELDIFIDHVDYLISIIHQAQPACCNLRQLILHLSCDIRHSQAWRDIMN